MARLAQLDFLAEAKNVIFLGPPRTGKTHLSIALGVHAARRGHRIAFASTHDGIGPHAAAFFFALISSRNERASLIVSSNNTFSAWSEIFGDAVAVAAMVDRLVHHAEVSVLQYEAGDPKAEPRR